jgi:CRISPR-associated exonuclease Cas4
MLLLIFGFLLSGVILLVISSNKRRTAGLPPGRIVYSDPKLWGKLEKSLFDPSHNLTGRPDYLIRRGEVFYPVEVKSRRVSQGPYDSHIYQLAAYCMLVERNFGKRPPHGILHYPNKTFQIDFSPDLEESLVRLLDTMRSKSNSREIQRSHNSPARCRRCGFSSICDQALR